MKRLLFAILISLFFISCQPGDNYPVVQAESAKPVQVAQGSLFDGSWYGKAKSVPFSQTCGGAEFRIDITNSILNGKGSDLEGSLLVFNGFISEAETIHMRTVSTYIGNIAVTGRFSSKQTAKGTWKAGKGCSGTWILEKEK